CRRGLLSCVNSPVWLRAETRNGCETRERQEQEKTVRSNVRTIVIKSPKLVIPALAALGIGAPAGALELGPVRLDSTLGQPLRASIGFALRPHEQIAAHCIRVATGTSTNGFPSPGPTW